MAMSDLNNDLFEEMLNDYLIEMDKKCDKNDFKACVLAGLAISINDFKKWKNYNKYVDSGRFPLFNFTYDSKLLISLLLKTRRELREKVKNIQKA